jgi:ADP-heptose:LPS heptosyltransferase
VFVRTDRLGETLLNLPAVHALRRAMPQAYLIVMVQEGLRELLSDDPSLDEVVAEPPLPRSWWRRAAQLAWLWRSWRVETILVSNPKKEYHLGAWLAGIPTRVGYHRKWGWCLTHRLPDRKAAGWRHEVEANLELVRALDLPVPEAPVLQLRLSPAEDGGIAELLQRHAVSDADRLVAIHPWTSTPRKQWPWPRFHELIRRLRRQPGITLVVIGGREEQPQAQQLLQAPEPGVLNLVGQLSLRQLAALLRRAKVLVSNDSGPVHLAAAVGTPAVVLFGTADPAAGPPRWRPWGDGHTVIWKSSLEAVGVEEVAEAVQRYLPIGTARHEASG